MLLTFTSDVLYILLNISSSISIRYIRSYLIDFLCMQFSRYIKMRGLNLRASHLL